MVYNLASRIEEKHIVGLGYYRITPFSQRAYAFLNPSNEVVNRRVLLNYGTIYYKYKLLSHRFIDGYLATELGFGEAHVRLFDSINQVELKSEKIRIFPTGLGFQTVFKPIKWLGISAMGGFRFVNEGSISFNFNGWYYSFGLWMDVRQIYRDVRYYLVIKKRYNRAIKV